ncbi:RDD family protein, partial [Escherichia coli]|nr:RDD family protein [Escherichia coli]
MTVVVEKTPTTLPQATPNGAAPWHVRAGAFAIDVLPGLAVAATMALTALTVPPGSAWRWLCACLLGLTILLLAVNRLLLPTITGWSLG